MALTAFTSAAAREQQSFISAERSLGPSPRSAWDAHERAAPQRSLFGRGVQDATCFNSSSYEKPPVSNGATATRVRARCSQEASAQSAHMGQQLNGGFRSKDGLAATRYQHSNSCPVLDTLEARHASAQAARSPFASVCDTPLPSDPLPASSATTVQQDVYVSDQQYDVDPWEQLSRAYTAPAAFGPNSSSHGSVFPQPRNCPAGMDSFGSFAAMLLGGEHGAMDLAAAAAGSGKQGGALGRMTSTSSNPCDYLSSFHQAALSSMLLPIDSVAELEALAEQAWELQHTSSQPTCLIARVPWSSADTSIVSSCDYCEDDGSGSSTATSSSCMTPCCKAPDARAAGDAVASRSSSTSCRSTASSEFSCCNATGDAASDARVEVTLVNSPKEITLKRRCEPWEGSAGPARRQGVVRAARQWLAGLGAAARIAGCKTTAGLKAAVACGAPGIQCRED